MPLRPFAVAGVLVGAVALSFAALKYFERSLMLKAERDVTELRQEASPPPPTARLQSPSAAPQPAPVPQPPPAQRPPPAQAQQLQRPAPTLPEFPWPPPEASASYVLPTSLLAHHATIKDVVDAVLSALERNDYVEHSLFTAGPQAEGVALVTRLERINEDGSPRPDGDRWPMNYAVARASFDLATFLRGLFFVDPGHYRVIVFVFSGAPFSQSSQQVSETEARGWLLAGANILPPEVAARRFDGHCTVLIYEFASDGTRVRRIDSPLTGKQHLEKAGVLSLLQKTN